MNITSEMTNNYDYLLNKNCHGELLVAIADDFNLNYYKDVFKAINTIHDMEGHLNHDLYQVRNRFRDDMKNAIISRLNGDELETVLSYI